MKKTNKSDVSFSDYYQQIDEIAQQLASEKDIELKEKALKLMQAGIEVEKNIEKAETAVKILTYTVFSLIALIGVIFTVLRFTPKNGMDDVVLTGFSNTKSGKVIDSLNIANTVLRSELNEAEFLLDYTKIAYGVTFTKKQDGNKERYYIDSKKIREKDSIIAQKDLQLQELQQTLREVRETIHEINKTL